MPVREQNSNKGTFGKVLNVCGSKDYIGAAYLATVSSLKIGAGFSALYSTPDVIRSVSALLPEAVYLRKFPELKIFSVVLIGCGLGNQIALFKKVIKKLQDKQIPVVIDADGLNILSKLRLDLPQNLIITPHPLEAARLLDCGLNEVLNDLEGSAKRLTEKYNCVTVLKTHRTIICSKDEFFINQHGNSALAKAGSGDVLAGIIAGLLAQGVNLFEAAKLGVYLHSRAGEIASEELTEYCVLASDIPKYLHKAVKEIL
ncbi:MAG: NAD(P)H-hydrate dehydratase [Candidatus Gastranaerophilales bacterium]|nr:NAD(P)H-hydrate dehydratase [Candidatus Gastranaerophilales bacterium]MCM1073280.1 NAD(P)H-hydrate dehydratase [Bacteroides sp.]